MKIVATVNNINWGYLKGDILEVDHVGYFGNDIMMCNNLTNPKLTKNTSSGYAVISSKEYEIYNEVKHAEYHVESIKEIKLFGITIMKKVIKKRNKCL